jgi:uncharacterized protein
MKKRRVATPEREIRVYAAPQKFEVRKNADGSRSVSGYFATFNTLSRDLGFREKLLPGCFSQSLKDNPVQCLFNHDGGKLLGRTESGTLDVREDSKGLRFDVKLPDTSYANDLVALMERGDAYECSFAFNVPDGGDDWSQMPNGSLLRTISTAVLYEGSILVSPAAYPKTSANLRSLPTDLRSKLRDSDDCDDLDEDDPAYDDLNCDERKKRTDNGETVTDADGTNAGDEEDDRCDCPCSDCKAGDCDECSNAKCTRDECSQCPAQQRSANRDLLARRLRF